MRKTGGQILLCSDVGASFGTNGLSFSRGRSKGNLGSFEGSKFITRKDDRTVDFRYPSRAQRPAAEVVRLRCHPICRAHQA